MSNIHKYLATQPLAHAKDDMNPAISITYVPGGVMPGLVPYVGRTVEIRIPSKYLVLQNPEVTESNIWGGVLDEEVLNLLCSPSSSMEEDSCTLPESVVTSLSSHSIYTDDSDPVAIVHHTALFPLRTVAPPFPGLALLCRVLPPLPRYPAYTHPTSQYSSRSWAGQYDKCSLVPLDAYPLSDALLNTPHIPLQQRPTVAQAIAAAPTRRTRAARASAIVPTAPASVVPVMRMTTGAEGAVTVGARRDEEAVVAAVVCASAGSTAQVGAAEEGWVESALVSVPTGDPGVLYGGARVLCAEDECAVEEVLCRRALQCYVREREAGEWAVYELRRTGEVQVKSDGKAGAKTVEKPVRAVFAAGEDDEGLAVPYTPPAAAAGEDDEEEPEELKPARAVKGEREERDDAEDEEAETPEEREERERERARERERELEREREREKLRERRREVMAAARAAVAVHGSTRAVYSWTRLRVRARAGGEAGSDGVLQVRNVPVLWDEEEHAAMRVAATGGARKRGRASKESTTTPCLDALPGLDKKTSAGILEFFDKCVTGGVTGLDGQSVLTVACAASSMERGAGNIEEEVLARELFWEDLLWGPASVSVAGKEYGDIQYLRFVRF